MLFPPAFGLGSFDGRDRGVPIRLLHRHAQHDLAAGTPDAVALLPGPPRELYVVQKDEDVSLGDQMEVAEVGQVGRLQDRRRPGHAAAAFASPPRAVARAVFTSANFSALA